ncbi:MAG: hypothetical protein ABJA37_04945 [Ferruginibacter sp.]
MFRTILIFFLLPAALQAQPSDFIILKKKDRTIQTFYAGTNIEFVSTGGAYRNALITQIKNDSIFLQEFLVRRIPSTLGFIIYDTAGSFRYAYNYKEIKSFGRENKHFNVSGSGAALLGGGTVLALASGVVYLADRQKFSPGLLVASVGLAGLGYLMMKSGSKAIVVGRNNYNLQYMNMSAR